MGTKLVFLCYIFYVINVGFRTVCVWNSSKQINSVSTEPQVPVCVSEIGLGHTNKIISIQSALCGADEANQVCRHLKPNHFSKKKKKTFSCARWTWTETSFFGRLQANILY